MCVCSSGDPPARMWLRISLLYVAPVCVSVCGSACVLRATRLHAAPHVFYGGPLYVCECSSGTRKPHVLPVDVSRKPVCRGY